ncbi:hypothetical protein ABE10_01540, partial [Bacillus toyonensis]|nr:hypothetical protein [Bacillus toyonensis]
PRVEEAGREEDEGRRTRRRLRAEQDPRLLPATHGMRMGGDQLGEEGVELPGRDAAVPVLQRGLQRRDELVEVTAGPCRDVHPRRPGHVCEVLLDLALQVAAPVDVLVLGG